MSWPGVRLGVDVGGTFTDVVVSIGRQLWSAKSLTTHDDWSAAALAACGRVAEEVGTTMPELLASTDRFGLGTTAVTNVLATRQGQRVGLLTTAGSEDTVPFGRGVLVRHGPVLEPLPTIVSRGHIRGVNERIDRDGKIVRPLDADEVLAAGRDLVDNHRVGALAVSFLWAFENRSHEDTAVGLLRDAFPDLPIYQGAAIPVIREYERSMLAVLNAYSSGALVGIEGLVSAIQRLGCRAPLTLIHSGGGMTSVDQARRSPIVLAESGPAAGVAGAAEAATRLAEADVITCDMGGTSVDIGLIKSGSPERITRGPCMGYWTPVPRIDVQSIGAGGGSVAWTDARGMLRVGPRSAGSAPGPACYGIGGDEPTVTDALVVLGFLDPDRFLGGSMVLDGEAAERVCQALAQRLSLSTTDCAWGIRRIALEEMSRAVRSLLTARGLDAATHSIVSYGGCGGLFSAELARAIGVPRVIVPDLAPVLSAFGAAAALTRLELERTISLLVSDPVDELALVIAGLHSELADALAEDSVTWPDLRREVQLAMRFQHQVHEFVVSLGVDGDAASLSAAMPDAIDEFRRQYERHYGVGSITQDAPVEVAKCRVVGHGKLPAAHFGKRQVSKDDGPAMATRRVTIEPGSPPVEVQVLRMANIPEGHQQPGPAIVDAGDTTVWVPPGVSADMRADGSLVLEVAS